jgi:hypothetical protein
MAAPMSNATSSVCKFVIDVKLADGMLTAFVGFNGKNLNWFRVCYNVNVTANYKDGFAVVQISGQNENLVEVSVHVLRAVIHCPVYEKCDNALD